MRHKTSKIVTQATTRSSLCHNFGEVENIENPMSRSTDPMHTWVRIQRFDAKANNYMVVWSDDTVTAVPRDIFEHDCNGMPWIDDWWATQPTDTRMNPKKATVSPKKTKISKKAASDTDSDIPKSPKKGKKV